MSATGAIRAGAAYVEVFLEQNRIARDLSAVQSKLRAWSASLSRIGAGAYGGELPGPLAAIARFATSPAGMFAGFLTAAKMASEGGDEMVHLAEKAGTSVEAISALAYAARRADVNSDSLATSIKKMQVNIVDAARGGKQGQEALLALGLTAAELGRLLPEEQFKRVADRIAAIENPSERAAAAVKIFGRNGTELLPMILDGAQGIAKWEDRARRLGLVMNSEVAEGAHRFSLLLGDLHDVVMSGAKAIGGAIIPELTRFIDWIVRGTAAARDWIKDHKQIVVTALQLSGAIVAGGVGFAVLSKLLGMAASGVGFLIVPFRILAGLVGTVGSLLAGAFSAVIGTVSTVGATLGLLLTPMGLLIGAAVALAGYFLWSSGAIGGAVDWLKDLFAGLADDATKTFRGIGDALAAGDISLAAKVLWALIGLEWQKGIAALEGVWETFKGFWSDAITGLAIGFTNGMAALRTAWVDVTTFLTKIWNRWAASTFEEGLADFIAPVMAKILGVDTQELRKTMHEDFARNRAATPAQESSLDQNAEAQKRQIEKDRQGAVDQLGQDKLRGDRERQDRIKAAQAEADAARKELDDAVGAARDARAKAEAAPGGLPGKPPPTEMPDITNLAAERGKVVGTFSSYGLSGLGGEDVQKKMEAHLADIKVAAQRSAAANEKLESKLGQGIVLA